VVLAAVTRSWRAIQHAPAPFMGDDAIVTAAVAQNYLCMEFAAANLRADRLFMLNAVGVCVCERERESESFRGVYG
jgi:hypothetical protein